MKFDERFPEEFRECARFHGHVCPGLAIGYAAAKAAQDFLSIGSSEDEEIVAIVENDSCAVDAIQVLTGCTFGKGNLVFRDWGKQVFTFMDRRTGRALRVALKGGMPESEKRRVLRDKLNSGSASEEDKKEFEELKLKAIEKLISCDAGDYFEIREADLQFPPVARIVETRTCEKCGEEVMTDRMIQVEGHSFCKGCA
jgi:formylmethanofuran dehydrogenase subunit E